MPKAKSRAKISLKPLYKLVRFPLIVVWRILAILLRPLRPILRPLARYLRGVRQEFKHVAWPTRSETIRLTFAVVVFSVIFAIFVSLVDYGLNYAFEKAIIGG